MEKFLLSVDGGGTKTEFCVSSTAGEILETVVVGCSNYKSVGIDAVHQSFAKGVRELAMKGIDPEDICYSVWGISGCDSDHDFELVRGLLCKMGLKEERFYLCNDGVLAFYAQAHEPGIVIIAGTGSIILGIDGKGVWERAGGWGYNISDVGSGYWIGVEALRLTLLYCDGCGVYAPLLDRIKNAYNSPTFEELPYRITEVTDFYEIAGLARLVVEAAGEGEITALGILREGAGTLASLTASIYRRKGFSEDMEIHVVFSGGVLKSEIYQMLVKEALADRIPLKKVTFSTQIHAPSYGGIKLAMRMLKNMNAGGREADSAR